MFGINVSKRKFFHIYLGNLFEHYDTALYGFLSPLFAQLFFPKQDYLLALILTYAMIPIGKLAKPIGSLFFGYIGDTKGRREALSISLLGMGVVTFCIGMIPSYQELGFFAPLLFLFFRLFQSFFAAGEITGGALLLLEDISCDKDKDLLSSIYSTSTIAGILFASFFATVFYHFGIIHTHWRFLYFIGAATAFFGGITRYFQNDNRQTYNQISFKEHLGTLIDEPKTILALLFASGFAYACYSMAFVLINGFIPLISTISKTQIMKLNTLLLILDFMLLPLFGKIAAIYSREKSMQACLLTTIITAPFMFSLLGNPTLVSVMILRVYIVTIGVWFSSTFHPWSQSLFPKENRYTAISFYYSVGSLVFGSTTAMISLAIFRYTQNITSICLYLVILASITSGLLYQLKRSPITA